MLALVTQREITDEYGEAADKLLQGMTSYLAGLEFVPVPVPNDIRAARGMISELEFGLLVLSGGGFPARSCYRDECAEAGTQPNRDAVERELIEYAREQRIPVLGICRGMHALNGCFGGYVARHASAYPARQDHAVRLWDGSTVYVNSWHDDAVPLDCLGDGLELLAVEEQAGTVEAFRAREGRALGLQWHPERPLHDAAAQRVTDRLIDELLGR